MNFKKRVNGSWHDIPHYIMGTSTDTITNLPAVVYPNDTTATVGLKGNMSQNGTPTPDNPIMPQGTGERTGNLFDWNWLVNGYHLDPQTGLPTTHLMRVSILQPIDVSQLTTAVLSYESVDVQTLYAMYSILTTDNTLIRRVTSATSGSSLDLSGGDKLYIAFYNGASSGATAITKDNITNIMLNTGSQPLPYEPYGQYKIPILCAGQTTPVYLGEVETTRKIKKLVLTGEENFEHYGSGVFWVKVEDNNAMINGYGVSNNYAFNPIISNVPTTISNNEFCLTSANGRLWIRNTKYSNAGGFKAYLAQQYANGTPVTVWYVLATEETGIVNEPLRKIGDYADEVSGISIPTTAGVNTISVDTTLQPSEVTVNYKGWHPVADVHEADNGAWT